MNFACTYSPPPPPLVLIQGSQWGGGFYGYRLSPGTKQTVLNNVFFFFFTIAKDCTERLSAVALSLGLIILGGQCVSGHVVQASFVSDTPDRNALTITVQLAFTI